MWRATLLSIFRMIELFVLLGDPRGTQHCFELLTTVEAIADKFSGKA